MILYVKRKFRTGSLRRDLKYNFNANWFFNGQDGFFLASLKSTFPVKAKPFQYLLKKEEIRSRYDWMVVNYKISESGKGLTEKQASIIKKIKGCRKALFIGVASARAMPGDKILDIFDLVFKREVYKDLDRYKLSERNKNKIRGTMLACPLVPTSILNLKKLDVTKYGYREYPNDFKTDVFFSGENTSQTRYDVVNSLINSRISFEGGLQDSKKGIVENKEVLYQRLSYKKYLQKARKSRINLALDGRGAFTFRHLELWCLCCFMISSPSIREINIPMPMVEGEHYISYSNLADLEEKICYFLKRPEKRKAVAEAGRKIFEKYYNVKKHGQYIKKCMQKADSEPKL